MPGNSELRRNYAKVVPIAFQASRDHLLLHFFMVGSRCEMFPEAEPKSKSDGSKTCESLIITAISHRVLKLPYIPGQEMICQFFQERVYIFLKGFLLYFFQYTLKRNLQSGISPPCRAKGWDLNNNSVYPVKKNLPETCLQHHFWKIMVCGTEKSYITIVSRFVQPYNLPALKNIRQFRSRE
jgi:hypothetical protein